MRTNITINEELLAQAVQLSRLKTKEEVIDEALKLYVQLLHQKALLNLRGKLQWEGNLEESRTNV